MIISAMRFGLEAPFWGCGDCSELLGQPGAPIEDDEIGAYQAAVAKSIAEYVPCSEIDFTRQAQKLALFDLLDEIAPLVATYFRVYLGATDLLVATASGEVVAKREIDEEISVNLSGYCRTVPIVLRKLHRWFCRVGRQQDGRDLIEFEREIINAAYAPKWI